MWFIALKNMISYTIEQLCWNGLIILFTIQCKKFTEDYKIFTVNIIVNLKKTFNELFQQSLTVEDQKVQKHSRGGVVGKKKIFA